MAFQTGTATSFINLLDALRLFATANGWTQNQWSAVGADQWLSLQKGSIYANLLASATQVRMKGALGYSGAAAWDAQPSTHTESPRIRDGWYGAVAWPVTYWFFQHTAPDSIELVIRYQPTRYMYLQIGAVTKYGVWPGGEYYCASSVHPTAVLSGIAEMAKQVGIGGDSGGQGFPALFWSRREVQQFGGFAGSPDMIHAEIDSLLWGSSSQLISTPTQSSVGALLDCSRHVYPLPGRSQSVFNGLSTLQPIELYMARPDGFWSPVGRIEHVRYAIVTNHNPADIIDIGGQKWMLFPWVEKGNQNDAGGLHYGMAIKYDGP